MWQIHPQEARLPSPSLLNNSPSSTVSYGNKVYIITLFTGKVLDPLANFKYICQNSRCFENRVYAFIGNQQLGSPEGKAAVLAQQLSVHLGCLGNQRVHSRYTEGAGTLYKKEGIKCTIKQSGTGRRQRLRVPKRKMLGPGQKTMENTAVLLLREQAPPCPHPRFLSST